jgi:hypothetical protein
MNDSEEQSMDQPSEEYPLDMFKEHLFENFKETGILDNLKVF